MRGNSISIKGNCTRDAEVRRTQSGNNAVSWAIAWNSRRKNQQTGEYEDVPHYIDVECWMSDAQMNMVSPHIVKGARCAVVDGHLEQQRWQDKNGNNRSRVVVKVDDPIAGLMLSAPQAASNGGYQGQPNGYPKQQPVQPQNAYQGGYAYGQPQPPQVDYTSSVYDDDIPF